MSLFNELKRRNVFRVAAAYIVTAWLVIQVVETIFPAFGFTDAAVRYVVIAFAIGLAPVVIFSWAFEITPEGLRKEADLDREALIPSRAGKQLDRVIMVVLALALGYFAFDKFVLTPQRQAKQLAEATQEARQEGHSEALVQAYGDKSIAVLPFVDMSTDKDQEYMSDGIAEELLNLLAKVPDLRVISRSSSFAYKGEKIDIPEVARKLNVGHILEGSVRKAGEQLRITVQLIEARSDTHLWSQTYDRKLDNIFEIQDEIAAAVVEALKVNLIGAVPKARMTDREAYTLVLRARHIWNRRAPGDEEKAMEFYQRALDIDPGYAPAWAGLSVAIAVQALNGRIPRDSGFAKAREAIETALSLDPGSSDVHVRMGQAYLRDDNGPAASREFQRALELDPNNPLALGAMATYVSWRNGRTEEALELFKKAATIDPLAAIWPGNLSSLLIKLGRLDEAEEAALKALELGPGSIFQENLATVYFLRHEYENALELFESLPESASRAFNLTVTYHAMGRQAESDAELQQLGASHERDVPFLLAMAHASRGEADAAFEWLERTFDTRRLRIDQLEFEPFLENLHEDPRWEALLRRLEEQG